MGKPENKVESYLDKEVMKLGGFTRKWISPGHDGVEDRICFFDKGEIWFIEAKVTGDKPRPKQWREIMRQRVLGHNAGYIAGCHQVDSFIMSDNRIEWMRNQIMR